MSISKFIPMTAALLAITVPWFATGCGDDASDEGPVTQRSATVSVDDATVAYEVLEKAETSELVLMVPSFARGPEDFTAEFGSDLAARVAEAGYKVVLPTPRGGGASALPGLTLEEMAADLAAILDAERGGRSVTALGHAFGNRVVRMLATTHAEHVSALLLVAAGERTPALPEVTAAITRLVLPSPEADKRAALELAFFAKGHDPSIWLDGWDLNLSITQRGTSGEGTADWRAGGGVIPMHVIQAADDIVSPPEVGSALLKSNFPDRVTISVVENAGHALLPEQPDAVAAAVLGFLGR